MIIYNVTIKIEPEIQKEWFRWMKETHIPDVMKTGLFLDSRICLLLDEEPESRTTMPCGSTYSIQYTCNSIKDYETYLQKFAPALKQDHINQFKGKFTAFRTLMEVKAEF